MRKQLFTVHRIIQTAFVFKFEWLRNAVSGSCATRIVIGKHTGVGALQYTLCSVIFNVQVSLYTEQRTFSWANQDLQPSQWVQITRQSTLTQSTDYMHAFQHDANVYNTISYIGTQVTSCSMFY